MMDKKKTDRLPFEGPGARKLIPEPVENAQSRQAEEDLRASESRLRRQYEVLVKLARGCSQDCNDVKTGLRKITEAASQTLEIERTGVWLYNHDHSKIRCAELYERSVDRHSEGVELTASSYPSYFKALEDERTIAAHDARIDPRTKEYLESYLSPLGISSMLDAPIRIGGQVVGVICHEHVGPARRWSLDEQIFAGSMADIVSLVMQECERKRAEKEIENSDSLLQATLESTADAILVVDRNGKMLIFNQKFVEMWGLPDSITALRDGEIARAFVMEQLKDPEGFQARVKELYSQPEATSFDVLEFKDGRVFERYSKPQRLGGKSVGRVWSFRDITERKRAEEALRDSSRFNQQVISNATEGIIVYDRDFRYLVWNPFMENLTGLRAEEVLGKNLRETAPLMEARGKIILQKESIEGIRVSFEKALAGDTFAYLDVPIFIKNTGMTGWTSARYGPFRNAQGKIVGVIATVRDVTESKRAEEEMRRSERRYRTLVEGSPDVIMNIDRQGTILFINHTLPQFTIGGVIGTNVTDYIPAAQAVEYRNKIEMLFDTGMAQSIVLDSVGQKRWESQLIPIMQEGKIETVLVIASDITERDHAAMELEKSVSLLRATLESTADGLLVVDNEGRMVSFNQKFAEMWCLPESIIASRDDNQGLAFATDQLKDPEGFITKVKALYNQPDATSYDILEFKDGRVFERYSQPQRIGGKSVGRVWSFRDITERKRAEETLRTHSQILQTIAEGVNFVDTRGIIRFTNPAYHRMFGYLPGELIGQPASCLNATSGEENDRLVNTILDMLQNNKTWEGEFLNRKKDGTIFQTRALISPIEHAGETWSVSVQEDITERKRMEEALRKAHNELERRVGERTADLSKANAILKKQIAERKRAEKALQDALKKLQQLSHHILQIQENEYQFISRELHDNIAQSVNAVKMRLERLDRKATPGFSGRPLEIRAAVTQLKKISQEVRKLSKQKRPEILDELGLTATLDSYIKDFQKLTGIRMKFINKTTDKLIPANLGVHLYRIVQESLNNIAQHARATHAVVRLEEIGKELYLLIKDNGIGFSLDHSVKEGKGLQGIGLISIQERANLLKGTIEIISNPGHGTKIAVRVPRLE